MCDYIWRGHSIWVSHWVPTHDLGPQKLVETSAFVSKWPSKVRGRPELSSFSQSYTVYAGGRGSMAAIHFLMLIYDALHFHMWSLKSTFSMYYFGRKEGVTKKQYHVYALDNVDSSGRPISLILSSFLPTAVFN